MNTIKTIKGQDGKWWWTTAESPSASSWQGIPPRHAAGFDSETEAKKAAKDALTNGETK